MPKKRRRISWKKVVTRETTLLERYLRMVGYAGGIGAHSAIRSKNVLAVSRDGVVEQYFDERETKRAGYIAKQEFHRGNPLRIFTSFERILHQLDIVTRSMTNLTRKPRRISSQNASRLMRRFTAGYGFGRGIIYYAHFAEDFASKELTSAISSIPEIKDVDAVLRVLTGPTKISPLLRQYFHPRKLLTKQQRSLLKRYPTLRRSGQLTKYLQWLSYYHEVGERSTSGCFVRFASFLEKLSTRTGVLVGDLQWYTEPELQALLRKGVVLSLREIRTRQKYYVLRMVGGKLRLYTGKEAHALLRQELPRVRVQRVDILRGVTACPGKPRRGVVRVIKKQADIEKMRRGDILVSPMTTPRLMEAVKHAAAIVTDEGGVTCHAAIVSRELHIPCIIGTKTASHVLHDGDRVLVDATAGIVRRLRNAVA